MAIATQGPRAQILSPTLMANLGERVSEDDGHPVADDDRGEWRGSAAGASGFTNARRAVLLAIR